MARFQKTMLHVCTLGVAFFAVAAATRGAQHPQITVNCYPSADGVQVVVNSTSRDSVSVFWEIYDGNGVEVSSGSYPPTNVPPPLTVNIPVPPGPGGPFTVIAAATGSFNGAVCTTTVPPGARASKANSVALTLDFGSPVQDPKNHWTVPVELSASKLDDVSLMYDAVYRDAGGKYHRIPGFPRHGGMHLVDSKHVFHDQVPVDCSSATYPVLFAAFAVDLSGNQVFKRTLIQ